MSRTSSFDDAIKWLNEETDKGKNKKEQETSYTIYALYIIAIIVIIAVVVAIIALLYSRKQSESEILPKIIIPNMLNVSTNIMPKGPTIAE